MKKFYLLAIALLLGQLLHAQNVNYQWVKPIGDTLFDEGRNMTTDLQGNVYTTGYFRGLVDFDPGSATFTLNSATDISFFVLKLNAQGQFLWAKQFDGVTQSEGNGLALDNTGNIFLTGSFSNLTDMDPGSATFYLSAQGTDAFVLKLDTAGNFVWAKNFGGGYGDMGFDIQVASTGHIYFTGEFYDIADFNPDMPTYNLSAPNASGIFVCKLNSDGSLVWAKSMVGGMFNRGLALDIDQNQNTYCTGYFSGTTDFDPGTGVQNLTSAGSHDIFLLKLDSAGNFNWVKRIGGTYVDAAYDLVCTDFGQVYFAGTYAGVVDFNPGNGVNNLISGTNSSAFISKFDASGNFIWAKSFFGSSASCIVWGIALDPSNNVYSTGFFYNNIDFDPSSANFTLSAPSLETDSYITKLDSNGNFIWALPLSGSGGTATRCVHYAQDGSLWATGYFSGMVDFDPSASSQVFTGNTNHDLFILKLSPSSPTAASLVSYATQPMVYPNPAQGTIAIHTADKVTTALLYSLEGRKVKTLSVQHNLISLEGIQPGMYVLQYTLGETKYTQQIMVR